MSTTEPSSYDSLKASYTNPHEQKTSLSRYGYGRDDALSNHNQQAYYNKTTKKLLYNVTGTHDLGDWGTNAYLAAGKIKDTNRYKSADKGFKEIGRAHV